MSTTVALAAKRYDGANGSAVFSGTVPFAPGVLPTVAAAQRLVLWDGSTEVGITRTPLYPVHLDGSLKAVKIDATLSLTAGSTLALTLVTDTTPTQMGPGYTAITEAWMRAARLIGCTDPLYLCNSEIAPWPLTPANNPSLPDGWRTFLTTQFDGTDHDFPTWGNFAPIVWSETAITYGANNANYDPLTAIYSNYLITGNLDRLMDGHRTAVYKGNYVAGAGGKIYDMGFPWSMAQYAFPAGALTFGADWAGDDFFPAGASAE